VTIAVRDIAAGRRVAAEIEASQGTPVAVAPLDLSRMDSIAAFVAAWDAPLRILVDNAGVMAVPDLQIAHCWELQFSTNHLGHFALASALRPWLAAAGGRAHCVAELQRPPTLAGRVRRHQLRALRV
jgi:NAD(P)-dependent dehydrogenase (short-subunit alcohol dehydrogenase family)